MHGLTEWGWTQQWAKHIDDIPDANPARVIAEHKTCYTVQTNHGERTAHLTGRLRHLAEGSSDLPAVGDWILISPTGPAEEDVAIHGVLPRQSKFSRKEAGLRTSEQVIAANIDFAWIVSSLDRDFNVRRLERYLTLAWESGATPVIVLSKADECADVETHLTEVELASPATAVHAVSSVTYHGLDALRRYLQNDKTIALLGSSGVGKSTLINALAATNLQETGVTRSDGKGRHTTTSRHLIRLPEGGLIIDSPGMRELQLWQGDTGLSETFDDVLQVTGQCRFSDCQHQGEPGCAVQQAIDDGALTPDRVASYQKLQKELAYLERRQDVHARGREKRRFRSITKAMREKYKRDSRM